MSRDNKKRAFKNAFNTAIKTAGLLPSATVKVVENGYVINKKLTVLEAIIWRKEVAYREALQLLQIEETLLFELKEYWDMILGNTSPEVLETKEKRILGLLDFSN